MGRDGERRILCSDHTKDGGEGTVMFLKDLSTTEKKTLTTSYRQHQPYEPGVPGGGAMNGLIGSIARRVTQTVSRGEEG